MGPRKTRASAFRFEAKDLRATNDDNALKLLPTLKA